MFNLLLVMLGGAIGAGGRHLVGKATLLWFGPGYPWGTLSANIIGGFVMGLLAGTLARTSLGGENIRLFIGVGMLGGFTTFSSFSLDAINMLERGDWITGIGYVLVSVIGSLLALTLGLGFVRAVA
ncbi:fluoride efflux transporter CrcB [Stakelama marina]|uniref:Fluoride-specific ion channel FluC n=1 Tax=Stakelama marina TaxID=2826939 RepID=A0A8T4ICZ1_9SPHN|nr:fluoride efflux transporter CrcB [Stakelama marina]MBR0552261.1 fluoride efflux transporter CrcB [Stakelama marina]